MANESFWIIFPDEPNTKYPIDEPINFRQVDFNLDRKENGHALDVSLSGGKVNFRFTDQRNHYLDRILYWNHYKGFEASVLLGFSLETGEIFIAEFDFYTATTNDFNYFECSLIVQSQTQIFKRRSETKIDLFSDRDINGNVIAPLVPVNMLLQAKPATSISEWKQNQQFGKAFVGYGQDAMFVSIADSIVKSGIQNTLIPFNPLVELRSFYSNDEYKSAINSLVLLELQDNIQDANLNITGLDLSIIGGAGVIPVKNAILLISKTFDPSETTIIYIEGSRLNKTDINVKNKNYSIPLPNLDRGTKIAIAASVFQPGIPAGTPLNTVSVNIKLHGSVTVSADSIAYNSVFPTFRLIDVMRQVSKSISGLEVYAPRYDVNGEFYDTILTNGNLLRNIQDKPFYISWEDIEKSIVPEHNADSKIMISEKVFIGIEKDFYTNYEDGFFDNTQFSSLTKKINPEYALNKFGLKYGKYQSLKESTEPNSESTIHGESQLTPYNQKVENSKENSIDWVRDAILLDVQQRLSTKVTEDTATQEDDTIFAIDTIVTKENQAFTETTTLQHTYLGGENLSLRTDGEVNFIVLGIRIGTVFNIATPDSNNGDYTVTALFNTELQLTKISGGGIGGGNNGVRSTKYTYQIIKDDVPLTNRTSEGFSVILNLSTPNRYSNLRYSVERNIRNYWNSFLATVNLYWSEKPLKNTYYKNNGSCETEYNGLRIIEKEDFIPTDPIVTPVMYEDVIFANVEHADFLALQSRLRNRHGYIRTIDNNSRVLKLYPLKMSYEIENKQLTISGKEKYEKSYLEIVKNGSTVIINGETYVVSLKYEVDEGNKIILLDSEDERLYNGIYWNQVSVNGEIATTLNILKNWLDLLK